jgi:hypothetical protein
MLWIMKKSPVSADRCRKRRDSGLETLPQRLKDPLPEQFFRPFVPLHFNHIRFRIREEMDTDAHFFYLSSKSI